MGGNLCDVKEWRIRPGMQKYTRGCALLTAVAVASAVVAGAAQAPQGGRGGRSAAGQAVEKIRPLAPGLHLVTGGGANTLVRVTPEGLIVVDTKNPGEEQFTG